MFYTLLCNLQSGSKDYFKNASVLYPNTDSYIKEKLKPAIQTEHQLIYLCHLFAPFMARLDQERARVGYELTTLLYELLEQVDKKHGMSPLIYMDPICDLL